MVDFKLIGSRINQQRENRQLTQEVVAEQADITTVYLSKIENGKVTPTLTTLDAICSILNCDLGSLLVNSSVESNQYQAEKVIKLFNACKPEVKQIALNLLTDLSKL